MYLLRDLGGHGDAGLADEGPEESAHGAQVLDVDGAQLGHADQSEVSIANPRPITAHLPSSPWRSYCRFLLGSDSTAYAVLSSLNFSAASSLPGF